MILVQRECRGRVTGWDDERLDPVRGGVFWNDDVDDESFLKEEVLGGEYLREVSREITGRVQ